MLPHTVPDSTASPSGTLRCMACSAVVQPYYVVHCKPHGKRNSSTTASQTPGRQEPGRQEPGRQEPGRQATDRQAPARQADRRLADRRLAVWRLTCVWPTGATVGAPDRGVRRPDHVWTHAPNAPNGRRVRHRSRRLPYTFTRYVLHRMTHGTKHALGGWAATHSADETRHFLRSTSRARNRMTTASTWLK